MENPKRLKPLRGKAALLATACLLSPLFAGEPAKRATAGESSGISIQEARELLRKGDESYKAGRYGEAVEAFSGARSMLPQDGATHDLHDAATERYVQASVQHGRDLAKKGDIAAARSVVDRVLDPEVAPQDLSARTFRAELDDPVRTNPALDAEHARNVDEVRRLLYTAEGAYNLAKYDEASLTYEKVLRIDPYNSSARRGMERVAAAKSGYHRTSHDHTRAELLAQVDGAWELPLEPLPVDPSLLGAGVADIDTGAIPVANKLDRIIIPQIALEQASLSEAIDFLRIKVAEVEDAAGLGGVNFNINLGEGDRATEINARRFDLRLNATPLSGILRYITDATGTSFTTDQFSVIIQPLGGVSDRLITRTYKVPPNFISSINNSSGGASASADPFATPSSGTGGLLATRLGAQEALAQQGVAFPEGASASFNPGANVLRVTNTEASLELISHIIDTIVQEEPINVAVRVTMIKTEQENLEELGFDWTLEGIGFNGDRLNLTGGTQGNGSSFADVPSSNSMSPFDPRPITAGNRSGEYALNTNALDDIIAGGSDRNTARERAPGVLRVSGVFGGNEANMLMRGLSQKKGTDLMTNPTVITRSGQAASVRVVREFIYPTEYEPPELPQSMGSSQTFLNGILIDSSADDPFPVTPATPTAFETKEVGVVLEVLPTADPNKQYIEINLNPSVSDFDGFVNYGTPISIPRSTPLGTRNVLVTDNSILMPVFSVQRMTVPSLTVADGATIVIGGLLQQSMQNVEDKTPVLGDLPVVGRMFQSKAKKPRSTAIIFLVNVELLDPTGRPFRGGN